MIFKTIKSITAAAFAITAMIVPATAQSDYPSRPITLIVPFSPGGGADMASRLIASHLSERLGQPIVVEQRTGASGNVGFAAGASAEPDGYTITTLTQNIVVNANLVSNLPFDPLTAFEPIAIMVENYSALIVNPDLPVNSVEELVAYGLEHEGVLTAGHGGVGGQAWLSLSLLSSMTGLEMAMPSYRGEAPVIVDLINGQLDLTFQSFGGLGTHAQEGNVRPIGITAPEPADYLEGVPPIANTLPGYSVVGWYGLAAPAGTPREIVSKLATEIQAVLELPEVHDVLVSRGFVPGGKSMDEFRDVMHSDYERYKELIESAGIAPQ